MVYLIILSMLSTGAVCAQTLELRQIGVSASGEVEIAVVAELADARASGVSFYVAIPEGAFEVVGAERPFAQGPLMAPAVEFANETMPREEAIGAPDGMVLLPYAAVRGPGAERGRTGQGEVARFALRPLRAGPLAVLLISTPIYETKLVLDDGVGERAFETLGGLVLNASGLESEKPAGGGQHSWAAIKAVVATP